MFEKQLGDLKSNQENREEPIRLSDFKAFTEGLKALVEKCTDPNEQAAIVRKLVERIEVKPDGIVISYHVGQSHYVRELAPESKTATKSIISNESSSHGVLSIKKGLVDHTKPHSKPLSKYRKPSSFVACSNTLTNGRG